MVMSWSVVFVISLALVKCQNRVLDPMSAMRDDISRIKVTMESVEEQLEKFNSLYLGKLETKVVLVANSLGHIDSNIKNLQERAHVWDTFQLHVSAWNEQIKAVDKKLDLLNRGYDKWEAMSDKVSQLPATEVALNKILNRLDELDLKFTDLQRRLNSTLRPEQPLLPEFAGRGVLSTLKDIETKVTKISSDNKQCGHHSEGGMQREILTMVNDMAGKIDFLVDKVPVKRNAKEDDPGDVDIGDEDYPENGASEDEIKRNPEKEFIKLWRKMVHPFRKANKKFEMLDRVLVEMEKFVNASNIATRDSSPLLSEIQSDIQQINQCCKNNDVYLKNGIKTLENAVDGVSVSVNELLRGNEKCNSFYQEQIQQQTYEIKNVLRSILTGKEAETKEVDVFLESRGREETVSSTEPTLPPPSPQQTSCHELRASGETQSKAYRVSTKELNDAGRDYNMRYCDMTTEGGGWTVIQRRGYFGEPIQNFSLGWQEYRYGFGDLNKEFWFGNDYIHRLTNEFDVVLRIDLWDFEGNKVFAEYETFKIDSEEDQYRLWVGGYKGNASDSFSTHSGYAFSTWDRDNDEAPPCCPCAPAYGGGWWFYSCFEANLNGAYHRKPTDNDYYRGIIWEMWRGDYSLRAAEMKVRPRTFAVPSQGVTEELIPEDP